MKQTEKGTERPNNKEKDDKGLRGTSWTSRRDERTRQQKDKMKQQETTQ